MSRSTRRWMAHLALLAVTVLAFVLRIFPPATAGFYPRCPVFFWLHLYCPGCGGTRALAALLHGRVAEALHWNAMIVAFVPFALAFFAIAYRRAVREATFSWPAPPPRLLTLCLAGAGVFTLARNLLCKG